MKFLMSALALWACFAAGAPALAQDKSASGVTIEKNDERTEASDKAFDETIKDLGELAGESYGCMKDENLSKHKDRVAELYNRINQLFGSDRGFLFASSFGYGAANEKAAEHCGKLVAEFDNRYSAIAEKYDLIR